MYPPNIKIVESEYTAYWLLTGVAGGIYLNRMSTASDRRDFPAGVSGSHMALSADTCYLEVPVTEETPFSYLLTFLVKVKEADLRCAGDAAFSGQYYDRDHGYSQDVFIQNSGEFASLGCDCLHHYSAAAKRQKGTHEDVLAMFPSALPKLELIGVEPLGNNSPPITITLFDGEQRSSEDYYRTLACRNESTMGKPTNTLAP